MKQPKIKESKIYIPIILLLLSASLVLSGCALSKDTGETQWLVVATSQELADAGVPAAISASFEAQYQVSIKWLPVSTCQALNYINSDSRIDVLLISGGAALDEATEPSHDFCKDNTTNSNLNTSGAVLAGPAPTLPPYNAVRPTSVRVTPIATPTPLDFKYLLTERHIAFWSPLVLVGPPSDPLHLGNVGDIAKALKSLGQQNGAFLSPGQEPAMRQLEEVWWSQVGTGELKLRGINYKIFDGDAHAALVAAEQIQAYTIVPLDVFLTYHNKDRSNSIISRDISMFTPYEAMLHNSLRCSDCDIQLARNFINYLLSPATQSSLLQAGQAQYKQAFFRSYDYNVYRPQP